MKKRNLFMAATILCGLLSVAFRFKLKQVTWVWNDSQNVGIMLDVHTMLLGIRWSKYQKELTLRRIKGKF